MVDLSPGATVRVVNPGATVRISAPGLVQGLWLKEGPTGPGGRGITSIARTSGTGAAGTTDTYTITYDDDTTSTFTVANGADGEMPLVPGPVAGRLAQVNSAGQVENSPLDAATVATQIGDLYTAVDNRVVGPASVTDARVAVFSGTTGKLLADAAYTVANLRDRTNHTGTQTADTVIDGTTNKAYTATEKTKLAGIATAATANATDAQLRDRSTHTGTQAASTITGLGTAATANTGTGAGQVPILSATPGTASATTYLTGAGTWATPAGGGGGPLAYVERTNGTAGSYSTTSTSAADVDSANLAVTFTAPASGVVVVVLEGSASIAATTYSLIWLLRSGTTTVPGSSRAATASATTPTRVRAGIRVTGLTPGSSYTYKWAYRLSAAGTGTIAYGGSDANGGLAYGPATMEVYAA